MADMQYVVPAVSGKQPLEATFSKKSEKTLHSGRNSCILKIQNAPERIFVSRYIDPASKPSKSFSTQGNPARAWAAQVVYAPLDGRGSC